MNVIRTLIRVIIVQRCVSTVTFSETIYNRKNVLGTRMMIAKTRMCFVIQILILLSTVSYHGSSLWLTYPFTLGITPHSEGFLIDSVDWTWRSSVKRATQQENRIMPKNKIAGIIITGAGTLILGASVFWALRLRQKQVLAKIREATTHKRWVKNHMMSFFWNHDSWSISST